MKINGIGENQNFLPLPDSLGSIKKVIVMGSVFMDGPVQNDYSARQLDVTYPVQFSLQGPKANLAFTLTVSVKGGGAVVRKITESTTGFTAEIGTDVHSSYGSNSARSYYVSWIAVGSTV